MPTQEEIARGAKRNGRKRKKGRLSTALDVDQSQQSVVFWGEVDPSGIVALTGTVSALGGAVTFGGSRDQGALQITIYLDGERSTQWASSVDEAESLIAVIWEKLQTLM